MALIIYDEVAEEEKKEVENRMKNYKVYEFIGTPGCGTFEFLGIISGYHPGDAINRFIGSGYDNSKNYVAEEIPVNTKYELGKSVYLNSQMLNLITKSLIKTGNKIYAIKLRREFTDGGLFKDAKDFVDNFECE